MALAQEESFWTGGVLSVEGGGQLMAVVSVQKERVSAEEQKLNHIVHQLSTSYYYYNHLTGIKLLAAMVASATKARGGSVITFCRRFHRQNSEQL